jgi:hypothetical protein
MHADIPVVKINSTAKARFKNEDIDPVSSWEEMWSLPAKGCA